MNSRFRLSLACGTIASLTAFSVAMAGAWTAPRGSIYAKASYGASSANTQFGFDGGKKPVVEGLTDYPFTDRSIYLYGEYGLTDEITVTGMVPFKRVIVHDRLFLYKSTGIGDLAVGARWRLYNQDNWIGSVSGSVSLPTGYHRDFQPPLGAGQMDVAVAANVGRSLWPLPGYATATVGYQYRSPLYLSSVSAKAASNPFFQERVDYSDEIFYLCEAGWTFWDMLLVHTVASGRVSLRGSGNAFSITSVPSTQRYLKVGGGAAVGLFQMLEVSGDIYTTVTGMNTVQSIDIFLGIGVKL